MKSKTLVIVLLLFIIAVFGWIGYVLFFPKSPQRRRSNPYIQTFKIESILSKRISTDYVKPIEMKIDLFSPLIVKLNKRDLVSLLKTSDLKFKVDGSLKYVSGVKSQSVNMVTLSLGGKNMTFDFNRSTTHFAWKGTKYVIVYFDPIYEGAVIMNISTGRLYTVTSQGLITK